MHGVQPTAKIAPSPNDASQPPRLPTSRPPSRSPKVGAAPLRTTSSRLSRPPMPEVFVQRFFAFSQFKRSALPNGPKVAGRWLPVAARRLAGPVGTTTPRCGSTNCAATSPEG